MPIDLSHLGLSIQAPGLRPESRSFRPPSWPPPKDWVCIENKDGSPVSRFGDSEWDFTPWAGRVVTFPFGDGIKRRKHSPTIDSDNANLLRHLVAWRIWGHRGDSSIKTIFGKAFIFRKIVAVCSEHSILASDLSRYPAVIDKVAQVLTPHAFETAIAELDRLLDERDFLGFELLDRDGIQRLKALQPDRANREQTKYIPPRIWTYIVNRVAECRNDFLEHQAQIEACFAFCVEAYAKNGAVEHRERTGYSDKNPFQVASVGKPKRKDINYYGKFEDVAQRFGIKDVIERWTNAIAPKRGIQAFTSYLQVVRWASLIDVAAYTLMRIDEATRIRWDCLRWEDDPVYGRIPLIGSETTKTDPDDSALWITSPSVEPSIRAMQSIARMRLTSAGLWQNGGNPSLVTSTLEPWATGGRKAARKALTRATITNLAEVVKQFPFLFDLQRLTLTEGDLKIARAVCPALNSAQFQVGKVWPLAWHQLRRTGAVNMFASGEISDSSMQLQMKHVTRLMSLYYGRGNTALHLNDDTRTLLVNAFYETMGRELAAMHMDRFISPHGDEHKARLLAPANNGEPVNLISEGDANHYAKIYRLHQIGGRLTVLGACMKNGPCDGDCVTSVADCAGGDGKAPCANVLFDVMRAAANQKRLDGVNHQLSMTPPDTPRYRHLEQEKRGLENYFAYIRQAA